MARRKKRIQTSHLSKLLQGTASTHVTHMYLCFGLIESHCVLMYCPCLQADPAAVRRGCYLLRFGQSQEKTPSEPVGSFPSFLHAMDNAAGALLFAGLRTAAFLLLLIGRRCSCISWSPCRRFFLFVLRTLMSEVRLCFMFFGRPRVKKEPIVIESAKAKKPSVMDYAKR